MVAIVLTADSVSRAGAVWKLEDSRLNFTSYILTNDRGRYLAYTINRVATTSMKMELSL